MGTNTEQAKERIGAIRMLQRFYDELMAQGAWCAHAYAFEYLHDVYQQMTSYMSAHGLDADPLKRAYSDAEHEFDSISNDPCKSFMCPKDTEKLNVLDDAFVQAMRTAAGTIAEYLGLTEEEIVLSPVEVK